MFINKNTLSIDTFFVKKEYLITTHVLLHINQHESPIDSSVIYGRHKRCDEERTKKQMHKV